MILKLYIDKYSKIGEICFLYHCTLGKGVNNSRNSCTSSGSRNRCNESVGESISLRASRITYKHQCTLAREREMKGDKEKERDRHICKWREREKKKRWKKGTESASRHVRRICVDACRKAARSAASRPPNRICRVQQIRNCLR